MKKILLIFFVSIIAFFACRHKKEVVQIITITAPGNANIGSSAGDSLRNKQEADSTRTPENYRFIVSFYSIGSGPDVNAHIKFITYLDNYQKEKSKKIAAEETPWGREGEVDYCMTLTELSQSEQVDFITNLKSTLSDAKWVHYFENKPCRYKRP